MWSHKQMELEETCYNPPPSTFHESKCYSVSNFQALICEICDGKFP